MSTLTVVRHGQARPFDSNPDQLSAMGEEQAQLLREYWQRLGVTFDEVWSGSLHRQRQTAELALSAAPQVSEAWNEYDANGILHHFAPAFTLEDVADRNRKFQKVFEPAMLAWIATAEHPRVETWETFRARVLNGFGLLQAGPSNRRIALFTSGGPIALLVQSALEAPERTFLALNWRVKNCSITEFTFSKDRVSLDSFNTLPHLESARLRTFR